LYSKVIEGDSEAFRHLISKYKNMAYSIAMSIVKDEFDAEEVLQVSFLKAYEKLNSFEELSKFSTWFYRIVVNESFKVIKKKKSEFVDFKEDLSCLSTEIESTVLKLETDDQKYLINEALLKLSAKESLALRLFYLDGNSIEEIGNITGWTESNIKVILHRARINLKYLLTKVYKIDKKQLYE
jgi:RNA polymerase sigma factor (sigma-70 family)